MVILDCNVCLYDSLLVELNVILLFLYVLLEVRIEFVEQLFDLWDINK